MDALSHAPVRPNETEGPTILGATLTVTIAAFITIVARLYVRLRMIRNVGWDVSMPELGEGAFHLQTLLGLYDAWINDIGRCLHEVAYSND
jgi:hypothetical protein